MGTNKLSCRDVNASGILFYIFEFFYKRFSSFGNLFIHFDVNKIDEKCQLKLIAAFIVWTFSILNFMTFFFFIHRALSESNIAPFFIVYCCLNYRIVPNAHSNCLITVCDHQSKCKLHWQIKNILYWMNDILQFKHNFTTIQWQAVRTSSKTIWQM